MKRLLTLLFFSPLLCNTRSLATVEIKDSCTTPACASAEESAGSPMKFSYDAECKMLKISMERQDLIAHQPEQADFLDHHNFYPFEEDFVLPEELWKPLGIATTVTIARGIYPVLANAMTFIIFIDLNTSNYR